MVYNIYNTGIVENEQLRFIAAVLWSAFSVGHLCCNSFSTSSWYIMLVFTAQRCYMALYLISRTKITLKYHFIIWTVWLLLPNKY